MGKINLEDETRYKHAKAEATRVWKELLNSTVPTDLNLIIKALGIHWEELDLKINGYSRMDTGGIFFILFRKGDLRVKQKFTVAHELGHIMLEHIGIGESTMAHSHESQEKEADTFAGELLLPSEDLKKFVKSSSPTLTEIAKRYGVSKDAAYYAVQGNRLINELTEEIT
jgi:Zn-dependent peptidase ImmA (M78 family)